MCKSSLPLYVDERPFSIDIPTPGAEAEPTKKTISFVELRVKQEYFVVSPSRPDFEVCKSEVLQNQGDGLVKYHVEEEKAEGEKGNEGLSSSPEEETEAFALAVETQPTSINTIKCVNRVVLVNHKGDRVLDTLVRPEEFPEGCTVNVRDGIKKKFIKLAAEIGPTLDQVAEVIAYLVKDKPLVGYHLPMKLTDARAWEPMLARSGSSMQKITVPGTADIISSKFASD